MEELMVYSLEELAKMFGDNFEIVVRRKDAKFDEFFKVVIGKSEKLTDDESLKKLYKQSKSLLKKTNKASNAINSIKGITMFTSVMGVMNLCATTAGFIIVCDKLDQISSQIQNIMDTMKDINQGETMYKFDLVIEEHKALLDGKDGGKPFTEDKYLELIKNENALLKLLYKIFCNETSSNRLEILQSILALSCMMAVAIEDFDTLYRYKYTDKKSLYNGHDGWMATFDLLLSKEFKEKLQDFFFIDEDKSQYETDLLVEGLTDRIDEAKQSIKNNIELLKILETKQKYIDAMKLINESVSDDISQMIQEANLQEDEQVLSLCKEASKTIGLAL